MGSKKSKNIGTVVLDRGDNTSCKINLHGATVISWRVNSQEQLFVSQRAVFDGKKAIRGGIQFVFPQYGPWTVGPQHGFARIIPWNLEKSPERLPNGDVEATFFIMDTDFTRSMWNYQFRLTYKLVLRERELQFNVTVFNPNKEKKINFTISLNTYLNVPDIRRCQITGFQGCTFVDKTKDNAVSQEARAVVEIEEWTDRVYQNTPQEHTISNMASGRRIRIEKNNFPDTGLWNPWTDLAKGLLDFKDNEYSNMVSVGSGHLTNPVVLIPGAKFEASQTFELI
ncbi:unnamed protein product [Brassicogethes aeneus]|uniref:glucose-6-phosphate 1-epimerase n=1 Tax=Brassicogethes aeneus TaxID=1431903 RepID=A0A9P0B3C2_BRAAE|nr:unnamed protein product [Brassicogethes aeneus]